MVWRSKQAGLSYFNGWWGPPKTEAYNELTQAYLFFGAGKETPGERRGPSSPPTGFSAMTGTMCGKVCDVKKIF
ncbi:hypothetical protein BQ8482_111141 [Mesorhizobium delmotii]|uniref:Uncharacterized protein n=1 Tax=Mesorhizobium delmotii TaxID=1631247 RepID=A0A2P9ADL4_9HYPH|nr:hypothetical protein BQ8482_111141 [Mesorhizobium delmotii]